MRSSSSIEAIITRAIDHTDYPMKDFRLMFGQQGRVSIARQAPLSNAPT
jgi:hypothetical protein